MYGQLGHGGLTNEVLPRKVIELMGSTVTQICCGRLVSNPISIFIFVGEKTNRKILANQCTFYT